MQNQKRVVNLIILSLLVVSFFSFSIVSAGWFSDVWGRITGNVVSDVLYPSCGSAVNSSYSSMPTVNLCNSGAVGNSSGSTGDGRWFWGCVGQNTGWNDDTAWCFARRLPSSEFSREGFEAFDCFASNWNNSSFFYGKNNESGMINLATNVTNYAFLCYKDIFYDCGWSVGYPSFFSVQKPILIEEDGKHIGYYVCDLARRRWIRTNQFNESSFVPTPVPTCYDSDGGLNYYVKGRATITLSEYSSLYHDDVCYTWNPGPYSSNSVYTVVSSCNGENCFLDEGDCSNLQDVNRISYNCPNGCVDGACVRPEGCQNGLFLSLKAGENRTISNIDGGRYTLEFKEARIYSEEPHIRARLILNGESKDLKIGEVASFYDAFFIEVAFSSFERVDIAIHTGCPSGLQITDCGSVLNFMQSPTDLEIEGRKWKLNYNHSYNYRDFLESYASWNYFSNNQYAYAWTSVTQLSDQKEVERRLDMALEYQLCDKQRIYLENNEYQTVYACKNFWRLARDAQRVSPQNNWNYNNDVVVMWFNENKLFNMEFSMNDYYNCRDSENCQRMEQENHQRKQEDLIAYMDSLLNNRGKWVGVHIDHISESFVKYFLNACPSQVSAEGYFGSWNCKQEPIVCPPHGEQTQKCVRYNSELGKEEIRERTISCNPGICSGCYVPKWFGDNWGSKCIEYGWRFRQETGDFEIVEESWNSVSGGLQEESGKLYVRDISRGGYPEFTIYSNNTLDFNYIYWSNLTYHLSEGDSVDLLNLMDDSEGAIQYIFRIDAIYYDSENYNNSYFDYTFTIETPIREYNYSYSYKVPIYLNMYCDIDGQVKQQKTQAWGACQNNFECASNLCSYGECVDLKGIADQVTGFKGFIVKMLCKLGNPLSEDNYLQCVANNA